MTMRRLKMVAELSDQVPAGINRSRHQRVANSPGLNLLSYPLIHQSNRTTAAMIGRAATTTGLPFEWFSTPRDGRAGLATDPSTNFPATIAHVQLPHLPIVALRSPRLFGRGQFVAAVCYWEVPVVKRLHHIGVPLVDEIWTNSEFCRRAFAGLTSKPVRVYPYAVKAPSGPPGAWRRHLGLAPETFVFAFQFDMASTTERKNPEAVIAAYVRAFPAASPDTCLVIKMMNTDWYPASVRALQRLAGSREDIVLRSEFWPEDVNAAFFGDIDCFVSLHRAEGFGQAMARAMAAGKPVIATGYSGNLEYMTDENSILVPADLVEVGRNPVYPARARWGEPDIDFAADAMRSVRHDGELRARLGARAAEDLSTRTSAALGSWIRAHAPCPATP